MLSTQARMINRYTGVCLSDYKLTFGRTPSRWRLCPNTATSTRFSGQSGDAGFKRAHSTFNGGNVVPSLVQRTPRERIFWGTLGTSFFGLAVYGGYWYRRRLKRQDRDTDAVAQNPTPLIASSEPHNPESLIRSLDAEHFSSVDWSDAIQTTLYFRSLVRASMVKHSTSTPITSAGLAPGPNQSTREDVRAKRFTEHFLHLVNLLVSLTPESLQNFVQRGRVLQGNELEAFCKTVEGDRKRMHEIMRDAAFRVHECVRVSGVGASASAIAPGDDAGRLLSEAYEKLAEIASKDEKRVYRVMKALFAVEMLMSSVGP